MQKILQSANARLYIMIITVAVMALIWRAGEIINTRMSNLPIKQSVKTGAPAADLNVESLYPVWVKQSVAQAATSANTNSGDNQKEIDALFKKEEEKKPELVVKKPPEPDFAAIFKASLAVDGYADDGIILGGRFYAVGEKLEKLTMYNATGKPVVPTLDSVRNGKATFSVAGKKVVVDMEKV